LIVVVVVLVVLAFNWLTDAAADVNDYVQAIEQNAPNAWAMAHDFALELQRNPAVQRDARLAERVAALLRRHLQDPPRPPQHADERSTDVDLRVYLCRALGHFQVPGGFPALMQAARLERSDLERDVRLAALEASAELIDNVRKGGGRVDEDHVLPTLVECAKEQGNPAVKSRAAYALGVLGGDEALAQLKRMLADGYPDARFNAATGLARNGYDGADCLEVLAEMLDPEQTEAMQVESDTWANAREAKRSLVHTSALQAVHGLLRRGSQADLAKVLSSVRLLRDSRNISEIVRLRATEVLNEAARPGGAS
jgi:HEAT repeat protein